MNRWVRGATALGLGFGLTVLAIEVERRVSDETEVPGTMLGALDITAYCTAEYGDRARAIHPEVGPFGWQCWVFVGGILTSYDVDTTRGCESQYGNPAYADPYLEGDPNGWSCKRGPAPRD